MKKNSDNIKDNDTIEAIVGEVLTEQEAEEKKAAIAKRNDRNLIFGSYITKSNDLIQKTKYSLPRNEQKILFMLLSKIDQKRDTDASKYYTITFSEFWPADSFGYRIQMGRDTTKWRGYYQRLR